MARILVTVGKETRLENEARETRLEDGYRTGAGREQWPRIIVSGLTTLLNGRYDAQAGRWRWSWPVSGGTWRVSDWPDRVTSDDPSRVIPKDSCASEDLR